MGSLLSNGAWKFGMYKATTLIMECSYETDFTNFDENCHFQRKTFSKMSEVGRLDADDILIEDWKMLMLKLSSFSLQWCEAQVEVDSSFIYKATCVKQTFSTTPLTKDRLKGAHWMSSESNNSASSSRDMIFVGDPVVASDNAGVFIGNVKLFELSSKKLNSIMLENVRWETVVTSK